MTTLAAAHAAANCSTLSNHFATTTNMSNNNNAVEVMGLTMLLGAALDFALAALFGLTDIIDLGDPKITQIVVVALIFAGVATLAVRPLLLKRIRANHDARDANGNRKLIE